MSTAEDEDETFKRFQGMCTGLEECKTLFMQINQNRETKGSARVEDQC